jgi:hypothetical protein
MSTPGRASKQYNLCLLPRSVLIRKPAVMMLLCLLCCRGRAAKLFWFKVNQTEGPAHQESLPTGLEQHQQVLFNVSTVQLLPFCCTNTDVAVCCWRCCWPCCGCSCRESKVGLDGRNCARQRVPNQVVANVAFCCWLDICCERCPRQARLPVSFPEVYWHGNPPSWCCCACCVTGAGPPSCFDSKST